MYFYELFKKKIFQHRILKNTTSLKEYIFETVFSFVKMEILLFRLRLVLKEIPPTIQFPCATFKLFLQKALLVVDILIASIEFLAHDIARRKI